MRMKPISPALALSLALLSQAGQAATLIPPDHPHLQYTGRIDFSAPGAPVLSWPNTQIAGNFTGTSLAVKLDDQRGDNFFNVFLDGDLTRPYIIQAVKGSKTYLVANGLKPGVHRFLITKRTEGEEGATVFQGLELDDNERLQAPPARPQRRIEFFGDSITSGMGNEAPPEGDDDLAKDKNSFRSYAALTARALNAELHMTSRSGIGVMISWFPFTMPDYYDQVNADGDNDSKWDFRKWTPDVVVINLMQNDSWLIGRDHKLQPEPDDAQRVAAYRAFVERIRALYPKAYIVCALGSMDATRAGSVWPGYVSAAVRELQAGGDRRIDTLFFEFTGYGKHPRVQHHEANAKKLTAFIRQRLGW
jgi:hypothetical protein